MYQILIGMMGGHSVSGENLFTNGGFDGNADGWTLEAGASYSLGKVTTLYDGDSAFPQLSQTVSDLIVGHEYELSFTISDSTDTVYIWSDGGIFADNGGSGYGDGEHNVSVTPDETSETITFDSTNYGTGTGWTIDDISLTYVGP